MGVRSTNTKQSFGSDFYRSGTDAASPGYPTHIGQFAQGGYFAGYISTTGNGIATHGLIVAPAASGYNNKTKLQYQTATALESNIDSSYDGATNTANMVSIETSTFPAGEYCAGLTINGYNDWYLPARWELEIAYYNLKPSTTENKTFAYLTNAYSVPARSTPYTTTDPAQTSVALFQSGGSEAFEEDAHWSSTQENQNNAYEIWFSHGDHQHNSPSYIKTTQNYVRAFRKFAL
jgi:hypothetical protein